MATGDYCTLDELKRDLWPDGETPDSTNDAKLQSIISGVSREIDAYCGTQFYDPGADATRYFTPERYNCCWIDPITTITSVATDDNLDRTYGTTWAATDWEAWPYNTAARRGLPYIRLDVSPLGNYSFPVSARSVKVVGRWCWNASVTPAATVPDIKQVVLLKCVRLFKRKDAPFGVVGVGETVTLLPGFDPDERRVLDYYKVSYT